MAEIDEGTKIHLADGQESIEIPTILPVLPARDVVVFPGVTVPLAVGREKSLAALEEATQSNFLIVASQRDPTFFDEPRRRNCGKPVTILLRRCRRRKTIHSRNLARDRQRLEHDLFPGLRQETPFSLTDSPLDEIRTHRM